MLGKCQHYVCFCITYIHKLLLRLKKYVSGDLLNNLLFRAVEITEIPNKLFMMFLCQFSCHAQHFLIHIDSGHRIKTNIKQKLTKNIKVSSHDFMNPESKNLFHKIVFLFFFYKIEFFNQYQIRQKNNELKLKYIRKQAIQKIRILRICKNI